MTPNPNNNSGRRGSLGNSFLIYGLDGIYIASGILTVVDVAGEDYLSATIEAGVAIISGYFSSHTRKKAESSLESLTRENI